MSQEIFINSNILDMPKNKENSIKKKIQCPLCNGYGMLKTNVIICERCNGNKCIRCNSTGLYKMPYIDCSKCETTGEILVCENMDNK